MADTRFAPKRINSKLLLLVAVLGLLMAATAAAQTYSVLYSFSGGADGGVPAAPVTLDVTTGNVYGTTLIGGTGNACNRGCGTVFELTPTGVEKVLYSFTGPDGAEPLDVFLDAQGNLFGTTAGGGAHNYGTVFRLSSEGVEKVLHSFKGGTDGDAPTSGLIQDPNTGDFYGVTAGGGTYSQGTLYKITATGTHTVLYSFGGPGTVGIDPTGKMVQDGKGNLYGMLIYGGLGCGAVFQFTPAGVETALYAFTGQRGDGCQTGSGDPGLVMDAEGNLFGTTSVGGNGNQGVVFELTGGGVEKVLHRFTGAKKGDGFGPLAGLVLDEGTGNLYGTTVSGGTGPCSVDHRKVGCGTIFELSPPAGKHDPWRETILHSFGGGADGYFPSAGLVRDARTGDLYGTVAQGGTYARGIVFKLTP